MVVCPDLDSYAIENTTVVGATFINVDYPPDIQAGNLLLLGTVRGDFDFVTNVTNTPTGWTLLHHQYGLNNYMHDVFGKVADGTETGFETVTFGGGEDLLITGAMICLRRNRGGGSGPLGQFDGSVVGSADTTATLTAPSLTPSSPQSLLLFFGGVPNGDRAVDYTGGTLCLMGGATGDAFLRSNQIYGTVIDGLTPSGEHTWSGTGGGFQSPWRGYAGGLIPWGPSNGPSVGFIGFGTF